MDFKKVTLILGLTILYLFFSASQSSVSAQTTNAAQNNLAPKITFERASHDFGKIKPGSTDNIIAFVFKNTGNANLVISEIENSCSCTISKLLNDKKEYAPGESGTILAGYTDTQVGQVLKHIYVSSNDPGYPTTELAIKAEVAAPISYEPKNLDLKLLSDNAGCPELVVTSLDNKPFSITGFQSTGNCITVNFNPQEKATKFVLKPQVDMTKLRQVPEGSFKINISHPDCDVVSGTYDTPPRFTANPRMISISEADPKKPVVKTINIISNYNEAFSVQASSSKHIVSILETKQTRNGYQVTVEIKPPAPSNNAKNFNDDIKISVSGGDSFVIPCHGYYPGTTAPKDEAQKCKICGPKRIDNPQFNPPLIR